MRDDIRGQGHSNFQITSLSADNSRPICTRTSPTEMRHLHTIQVDAMNPAAGETDDPDYWTPPESITDELDKYYFARYQAMMKFYREDQEDQAIEAATSLLELRSLTCAYFLLLI